MGGNALKNTYTRRYEREEFEIINKELKDKLLKYFKHVDPTIYYSEKQNFGDADFLCLKDNNINIDTLKKFIINTFNSNEIFVNSNCVSFDYKELQVDLILTKKDNYDTSLIYYSFNDLGNLIGKIAHKFHLKWGFDGLRFVYRLNDKKLGEIDVTKDYKKALSFLGFDVERYDKGFETLEDIFEYVISSKYFNPWLFDLEKLNRINRERDKKRNTYSKFLEYIEPLKQNTSIEDYHYFYHDKSVYLGLIDHYFPGFLRKYRLLEKREERVKSISEKFNGRILIHEFNITGRELGKLITDFKNSFDSVFDYEEYILNNDIETILNKVKQFI